MKVPLDANNMKYEERTNVQSSHLKHQLAELKLRKNSCTIAALDIVNMYPSIKLKLIRQAIHYYSGGFNEEEGGFFPS